MILRVERRRRLFDIRALTKGELVAGWRTLHNKELNNYHCSPNIIRLINSSRMRWEQHKAQKVR
jgi:hypothetical protein